MRRTVGLAIAVATVLVFATGLARCGACHAPHGNYRAQVDAFLDGRLAVAEAPEGLAQDYAWSGGGTQQVWGLGIPAWQTPFELVARTVGLGPFPDRLALLLWFALTTLILLLAWRPDRSREARPGTVPSGDEPRWIGGCAVLITAALPALVTMMRGRFDVYEEAAAYAYGAGMMLLGGTVLLARRPTLRRYLVLVGLAGLAGFIRPTAWFYGLATAIVATWSWLRASRSLAAGVRGVALAAALFVAGGAALYATNAQRFGRGTEFGHGINIRATWGNIHGTHFDYPFEDAGVGEAAVELVGALFDRPELSRGGFFTRNRHWGEASIARSREYYFTTFTWWYAPLLVAGLALGVHAWARRRADAPGHERELLAWAIAGGAPLVAFYLRAPCMSSRYTLDLAPALAALLVIAWRAFARRMIRSGQGPVAIAACLAAWAASVVGASPGKRTGEPVSREAAWRATLDLARPLAAVRTWPAGRDLADPSFADARVEATFERCFEASGAPFACDQPPRPGVIVRGTRTELGWYVARHAIEVAAGAPTAREAAGGLVTASTSPAPLYLDGGGWDLRSGALATAAVFYARDPAFVELELSTAVRDVVWEGAVRVAVGAVHLAPVSVVTTSRGVRIRYAASTRLPDGLSPIFLAVGDRAELDRPQTAFRLHAIRWREDDR